MSDSAAAVAAAYDVLADGYDTTYNDEVSRSEDRRLLRWLLPELTRSHHVLDIGCGTGWVLDHAVQAGLLGPHSPRTYAGLDLSLGMVKRLHEKHPWADAWGEFDMNGQWDLMATRQPDLITSTWASPSYADLPLSFLRRCHQLLQPGGRIVLVPHARGNLMRAPYLTAQPDAYIGDRPWAEHQVHRDALEVGLVDVQVHGLRHPLFGPGEHRGPLAHDLWMRVEPRLFRADSMCFLVVTATKPRR